MVLEQREELDPGRQPAEELVEAGEGEIRLAGAAELAQPARH
ncbi:MAG: hypothetical protein WDN69_29360 [Aliidongia sp.]